MRDPTGRGAHQPGAKLDHGKVDLTFLLDYWPHALAAVCGKVLQGWLALGS